MGVKQTVGAVVAAPKKVAVGYWRGLTYPFKGMKLVYFQHPSLVRIWIFPILIVIVVLSFMLKGVWDYHDALVTWMIPEPEGDGFWTGVLAFLHGTLEVIVAIVLLLVGFVAVMLLSNVLAAPFNDALSEETERIVTGRPGLPLSLRVLMRDLFRTIGLELAKLMLYALIMAPLWVASLLIPVVGAIILNVFGFLFTAMYWSIDYVDWPASRRNRGVGYRFSMATRHFWPMFGFGTGVWLFLLIPFVNLLFMPAAVAGGTLLYLDLEPDNSASGPAPVESNLGAGVEALSP